MQVILTGSQLHSILVDQPLKGAVVGCTGIHEGVVAPRCDFGNAGADFIEYKVACACGGCGGWIRLGGCDVGLIVGN